VTAGSPKAAAVFQNGAKYHILAAVSRDECHIEKPPFPEAFADSFDYFAAVPVFARLTKSVKPKLRRRALLRRTLFS
jgi:hypothetical protein